MSTGNSFHRYLGSMFAVCCSEASSLKEKGAELCKFSGSCYAGIWRARKMPLKLMDFFEEQLTHASAVLFYFSLLFLPSLMSK